MARNELAGVGVSLFAVLGLLIAGFLSLQIRHGLRGRNAHGLIVNATFGSVGGLRIGAPVKVAGVRVGRVVSIRLEAATGYKTVVALALDDRFAAIPADSDAAIQTASLLGGNYVAITPGGSDTPLTNGGEIHSSNVAFSLERLVGMLACRRDSSDCTQHEH